jgi:hypothetical protein
VQQRRAFLGQVQKWTAVDHLDRLHELMAPGESERTLDYPLKLDDRQFARLMDDTAVHSIVSQLEQSFEKFSRDFKPGDRIEFVDSTSKRAGEYGFREHSDIVAWCMGALMGGENFYATSFLTEAIGAARRDGSKLFNVLSEITEEQWQTIRSNAQNCPRRLAHRSNFSSLFQKASN